MEPNLDAEALPDELRDRLKCLAHDRFGQVRRGGKSEVIAPRRQVLRQDFERALDRRQRPIDGSQQLHLAGHALVLTAEYAEGHDDRDGGEEARPSAGWGFDTHGESGVSSRRRHRASAPWPILATKSSLATICANSDYPMNRSLAAQARALPVYAHEAEILDAVRNHQVVVIEGPTGSGKTTQVPQILLDAEITDRVIGVTQPRRIAAVSVAWRIAEERGVAIGKDVGYAIRFDDQTSDATRLKVMTDGILLQEARGVHDFDNYGVIVIDEAHERTLNIDFILGLLRRALKGRADLRVVVSSATLQPALFQRFFRELGKDVPLVSIDARPFPVAIRYRPARYSDLDGLVDQICRHIQRICDAGEEGDILVFLSGQGPIQRCVKELGRLGIDRRAEVLPLYGALPREDQERIFAPGDRRKIVLATNIAETSITVAGVRHVIDSGRVKVMRVNPRTGVRALKEEFVSQASADQRAGRAGRVAPGTCIRMYRQEDYDAQQRFLDEEVMRLDLREVVLRMLDLGVEDPHKFALPTRPPRGRLKGAIRQLKAMGAIDGHMRLTERGRKMTAFPLSPPLARAVLEAAERFPDVVDDVLLLVSALGGRQPWVFTTDKESAARAAHKRFHHPKGDALTLLALLKDFKRQTKGRRPDYCARHHVDPDILGYTLHAHEQLVDICEKLGIEVEGGGGEDAVIRCLVAGFVDNLLISRGRMFETARGLRVAVHPGSALWRTDQRFLVSTDIIILRRPYAAQVSVIQGDWIREIDPELAQQWKVRARKKPLERKKVAAKELPPFIEVGGVQLPVSVDRGRPFVLIDSADIDRLKSVQTGTLERDVARVKTGIDVGGARFSPGVQLRTQLKLLRWMPLPSPGDDLTCTVPEGALLDVERNLHALQRHIDAVMIPMKPSRGKTAGWCALVANGVGGYWFEVLRGLRDALQTTVLSLEDLLGRLPPDDALEANVRGKLERFTTISESVKNAYGPKRKRRNRGR